MKRSIVLGLLLVWFYDSQVLAQPCAFIHLPKINDQTRQELENKLRNAYEEYKSDTTNANALIWYRAPLKKCNNPDMYIATANWQYITL